MPMAAMAAQGCETSTRCRTLDVGTPGHYDGTHDGAGQPNHSAAHASRLDDSRRDAVGHWLLCAGLQVCWLRGLRLVFGASTAANAAVLAIFMGGLGLGALRLGPWADRHRHPLALYGKLELCVAVLAGLSPFLIDGIRWAYAALGGTPVLGVGVGTGFDCSARSYWACPPS